MKNLVLLLLLAAPSLVAETTIGRIERSSTDTRDYRAFVLDNGLTAMVVSDPDANHAAAALNLRVGGGNDPKDRNGMAHFLEHMLFLGTDKYPDANEYRQYLNQHGGSFKGYTSAFRTGYFFSIEPAHLEGALDRFAQFFIAPRFDRQYVQRERQVVHSEYISNVRDDGHRIFSALRQAFHPDHPLTNFVVGNEETLADRPGNDIRQEMIDFYKRTYSSHLMNLVLVGPDSLDALEQMVRGRFDAIPRSNYNPPPVTTPLYPKGLLPAQLEIEPLEETHSITLTFEVPSLYPNPQALSLASLLLGDESPGSLLSALKAKGWAEKLSAGASLSHRDFASFGVNIQATKKGIAHRDDVIAMAFAYIDLIRQKGFQPHYHQEMKRMAQLGFQYQERASASDLANSLAARLHAYPAEKVLTAPWDYGDFDPETQRNYLALLVPERALVTVTSKDVTTDSTTPYYETPYRLTSIPAQTIAKWRSSTANNTSALPASNPFIPSQLNMIDAQETTSEVAKIVGKPGFELWHHANVQFQRPRSNFYFSIRSRQASANPRNEVLKKLLVSMANDALNEFAYPASLAGQSYSLYGHHLGLSVRLEGWSDKQELLLDRILATLKNLPLPEHRFQAAKAELSRKLRNSDNNKAPYERVFSEIKRTLITPYWSEQQQLAELNTVESSDLRSYAKNLLSRGEVFALAHGNITVKGALQMGDVLERELLSSMHPEAVEESIHTLSLPVGTQHLRWVDSQNPDHALMVYHQGRDDSFSEKAKMILLGRMVKDVFFGELRTERKIGYIVFSGAYQMDIPGLYFLAQSPTHSPQQIHQEIADFIQRFSGALQQMPPEILERHRASLESALLKPYETLEKRSQHYWDAINTSDYHLDQREQLVKALQSLTHQDLLKAWQEVVASPKSARGLISVVSGDEPPATFGNAKIVEDREAFKNTLKAIK